MAGKRPKARTQPSKSELAAVDVASMSSAERRELLAKLGSFMGDE